MWKALHPDSKSKIHAETFTKLQLRLFFQFAAGFHDKL